MEGHTDSCKLATSGDGKRSGVFELRLDKPITLLLISVSLAACVCLVYWRVLAYPFVQDDWGQLKALIHTDAPAILSNALSIEGRLFYRPISLVYFMLYYKTFGLNPLYFHIIGLTIHLLNSLLVVFITRKLTGNHAISASAGLIYACAVTVHLDPLLWMVGFIDLSATLFYLGSLSLFLSGRRFASAAAFGLGLLSKESVIVLIVIFVLVLLYAIRPVRDLPAALSRTLWPALLVLVIYLAARAGHAVSPLALPGSEPYSMRLFGIHILKNLFRYAWWSLEAITPLRNLSGGTARWILLGAFILLGFIWTLSWTRVRRPAFPSVWIPFLASWAAIGIAPALLLPNHYYKYYLTYSLPPLILLALSGICGGFLCIRGAEGETGCAYRVVSSEKLFSHRSPAPSSGGPKCALSPGLPHAVLGILCLLVIADSVSAAWYFGAKDRAGISDRYVIGTNHLIHRGHAARLILDYLSQRRPSVPRGSVFLLEGCDLESLGGDDGFEIFYGDDGIRVFKRSDVELQVDMSERGKELRIHPYGSQTAAVLVEPEKLFYLRVISDMVREEDPLTDRQ